MSMTNFVVRIAFLLLPGIIASKIYQQLTGKKVGKNWEDFSGILLFSLSSYLILGLGLTIYGLFLTVLFRRYKVYRLLSMTNIQSIGLRFFVPV